VVGGVGRVRLVCGTHRVRFPGSGAHAQWGAPVASGRGAKPGSQVPEPRKCLCRRQPRDLLHFALGHTLANSGEASAAAAPRLSCAGALVAPVRIIDGREPARGRIPRPSYSSVLSHILLNSGKNSGGLVAGGSGGG